MITAAEISFPEELAEIAETAFEATKSGGYHRLPIGLSTTDRKQIWAHVFAQRRSRLVRPKILNRTNKKKLPFPAPKARLAMIEKHIQNHGITTEVLGGV